MSNFIPVDVMKSIYHVNARNNSSWQPSQPPYLLNIQPA